MPRRFTQASGTTTDLVEPAQPLATYRATRTAKVAASLFAIVLVAAVTACGSDDSDDSDAARIPGPTSATTQPGGTTDDPPAVTAIEITEIDMPDVTGMSEEDAQAELEELGFTAIAAGNEPSEEPEGAVIAQSPEPGSVVEPSATDVMLTVAVEPPPLMPDIVGDNLDDAEAALDDREVDIDLVVDEVDSLQSPGAVIEQSPDAGTELESAATVELTVAREVETPDFSEQTNEEIEAFVESLGGAVEVTRDYVPGVPEGGFVRQMPEPGSPLTEEVTIVRGGPAASLYLGKLGSVGGGRYFSHGNVRDVNGETYAHSLAWRLGRYDRCRDSSIEYNVSRAFNSLNAFVGYEDNAFADGRARVQIFTDGTKVFEQDYGLADAGPVEIDVTDVLRLKITVVCLNRGRYGDESSPQIVFGEARLLAAPEVIAEYE